MFLCCEKLQCLRNLLSLAQKSQLGPNSSIWTVSDLVSMGWRGNGAGAQAARQSKPQDGMSILYGHPKT